MTVRDPGKLQREKHAVEPDEDADDDEADEFENENASVICELYANVPETSKDLSPDSFVRILSLYTRDSHDGNYALVLEQGGYHAQAWAAVRARFGGLATHEILRQLAPQSPYPEGLKLAAKRFAEDTYPFDGESGEEAIKLFQAAEDAPGAGGKSSSSASLADVTAEVELARRAGESFSAALAVPQWKPHLAKVIPWFDAAEPHMIAPFADVIATAETECSDAKALASGLTAAAERHPERAEIALAQAYAYQRSRQHAKAIKILGVLLKAAPTARLYFLRGCSFLWMANKERAMKDFNAAIKLDSSVASYYASRAQARHVNQSFVERKDHEPGLADADRAIALQPIPEHFPRKPSALQPVRATS